MELLKKVETFINQEQLARKHDKIIVGVSGGVDSMVLYHILKKLEYDVLAVHINYQLRGTDALKDEALVRQELQDNVICIRVNTKDIAKQQKQSVQEVARAIRFSEFERIRKEKKFDKIAVATHLNDNIETFFINFIRGAGTKGLKAILPLNGKVMRPFLEITKEEIRSYASRHHIPYREDASNQENKYLRNRIRNQLMPVLKTIAPNIEQKATDNFKILRQEHTFLEQALQKEIEPYIFIDNNINHLLLEKLRKHPFFELIITRYLMSYGFRVEQIQNIIASKHLKGKKFLSPAYEIIFVSPEILAIVDKKRQSIVPELYIEETPLENISGKEASKHVEYIDKDKVKGNLTVRKWKKGDYFIPLGMKGKKKISDFLIDSKVPLYKKDDVYVVIDQENIIWVIGYRIDERYKISKSTKQVLKLEAKFPSN